jgi:hypothetical protein
VTRCCLILLVLVLVLVVMIRLLLVLTLRTLRLCMLQRNPIYTILCVISMQLQRLCLRLCRRLPLP